MMDLDPRDSEMKKRWAGYKIKEILFRSDSTPQYQLYTLGNNGVAEVFAFVRNPGIFKMLEAVLCKVFCGTESAGTGLPFANCSVI